MRRHPGDIERVYICQDMVVHVKPYCTRNIYFTVHDNNGNIERFVQTMVDDAISERLLLNGRISSKLLVKVLETLADGAQGMFLWVEMSLEALKQIKYTSDFKEDFDRLPP